MKARKKQDGASTSNFCDYSPGEETEEDNVENDQEEVECFESLDFNTSWTLIFEGFLVNPNNKKLYVRTILFPRIFCLSAFEELWKYNKCLVRCISV